MPHSRIAARSVAALRLALILSVGLAASVASAQERQRMRSALMVGAFSTGGSADVRVDSDTGRGTTLNLENTLGIDPDVDVGRIGGYHWFNDRHRFDGGYFDLSRDGGRTLSETVTFRDQTFELQTTISASMDFSVLKADYTFAPISRPAAFLGVTGGFYVAKMKFALTSINGTSETEDATAPLPVFGLRGEYAITPRLTIGGALQWFKVQSEDLDGRLTDFYVAADYRITRRFAVGLAYNDAELDVEANDEFGFSGAVDWSYDGVFVYAKLGVGADTR